MKKMSLLMLALLLGAGLQAQQLSIRHADNEAALLPGPMAKAGLVWAATSHDFGEIPQGVPVHASFTFTNTSSKPMRISGVRGSCGCTVTTYTTEAIAPGQQGYVTVSYNAAQQGVFRKTVTVSVHTQPEEMVLSLRGTVLVQKEQ